MIPQPGGTDGGPDPAVARAPRPVPAPTWIVPDAPALDEDATLRDVVRAGLLDGVRLLVEHDRVMRRDDDLEGIHQARVGLRRMRSVLRTFAPVLDDPWREELDGELREVARVLGPVREADVLGAALTRAAAALPDESDRGAADELIDRLAAERSVAMATVLDLLDSDRYLALVPRFVGEANHPRLSSAAIEDELAAPRLAALVRTPVRKLHKAARRVGDDDAPAALHRVRIKAKRARYAADLAVPVVGKPAKKLAKHLERVTDLLGDLHDAAEADAWLRRAAVAPQPAWAAGLLAAAIWREVEPAAAGWAKAAARADQAARRRWPA